MDVLRGTPALWALWLAALVATTALTLWLTLGARFPGRLVAAGITVGLIAWLLAPLFGLGGWLLRLPILRGVCVGAGGYLISLRPRHFPVVPTMRDRVYYGARV